MAEEKRALSAPLRSPPRWPSPPAESPAGSPARILKDLLEHAKASSGHNTPSPSAPPQPEIVPQQASTLQDLISQSNRTTQLGKKLLINRKNQHCYKTNNIIGSSSGGTATVYDGVYCANDSKELERMEHYDIYVAMTANDMDDQEEHERLVDKVNKSSQLVHSGLLRVKEDMVVEDKYYVVFLLMDESLRSLLKSVYTDGIPEDYVAIVLKEVLECLAYLHRRGHWHQELNAGHIYYRACIPAIKIGFRATVYEHKSGDVGQALPETLPLSEICEWAAAPEIYHLQREYTEKSDIWLVGITALELVFGDIQVQNREELELLIAEVKSGKGKGKVKAVGKYIKKMMKKMKIGKSGSTSKRKEVTLSRAFRNMLAACLTEDARERPSAATLLQHDFFKICDGVFDVYDFRNNVELERTEREMSAGSATESNVAGPSTGSNVASPSTGSNVAGRSTGSNVAGPSTGSNVASPSMGSSVAGPSMGSSVAGPSRGSTVAGTSRGSNVGGPSRGSNVAGPSRGSNVAGPSGSNVAGPSTGSNVVEGAKP